MIEQAAVARKNCPICTQDLPLAEFGVCRARKDGRNLYCKSCIRKKVTDSRRALKEYRSARKRYVSPSVSEHSARSQFEGNSPSSATYSRLLSKLSPVERVKEAIRKGAGTQKEIRKHAGRSERKSTRLNSSHVSESRMP